MASELYDTLLHVAAMQGNESKVLALIVDYNYDVNIRGILGRSLLHSACEGGNASLVDTLVRKYKLSVNARNTQNNTPLHMAAIFGQRKVTNTLIKVFKCDTKIKGRFGRSLLHSACDGGNLNLVRDLLVQHNADVDAIDDQGNTPVLLAAFCGRKEVVFCLIDEFHCNRKAKGRFGRSLLHNACSGGDVSLVRTLITKYQADVNVCDDENNTPLHVAAICGKVDVVLAMVEEYECDANVKGMLGRSLLHSACNGGNLDLVTALISKYNADVNIRDDNGDTPLHVAAICGREEVTLALINEFGCDINVNGMLGQSLLHRACFGGNVHLIETLVTKYKVDVNARDVKKNTPLYVAAFFGEYEVASALIYEFFSGTSLKCILGRSLLHGACSGGNDSLVKLIITELKADTNIRDDQGNTPLHVAALYGNESIVRILVDDFKCDVNIKGMLGRSLMHSACTSGNCDLVTTIVFRNWCNLNARDDETNTPLHVAALCGHEKAVYILIIQFGCDPGVKGMLGRSLLHSACISGNTGLVSMILAKQWGRFHSRDDEENTPLHVAALHGQETVFEEFGYSTDNNGRFGRSLLHNACIGGNVNIVNKIVKQSSADINVKDSRCDTPLHAAAREGREEIAQLLIKHGGSVNLKGMLGQSVLHAACEGGNVSLVKTLVLQHKANVEVQDDEDATPLHVAAFYGKKQVVLSLINDFNCDLKAKDIHNRSILHSACLSGNADLVRLLSSQMSTLVVDSDGNTPLHLCSALDSEECLQALLHINPPIMMRNSSGKTPRDVATGGCKLLLDEYVKNNRDKIYDHYDDVQKYARKKYSGAEQVTRIFAIGNPGAGKSSLIETLKREGFFESFLRVSESSVPRHTAGIVPSIYTSKHYGRVLFYDFAGDPEYYSSHAAILENVASTAKGDNLFILVVDLREDINMTKKTLHYWLSFIQYQNFAGRKPSFLLIGSHLDKLSRQQKEEGSKLMTQFYELHKIPYFFLDCCSPKSKQLAKVKKEIINRTKGSPLYELSLQASILLGLLEKDFGNVTAVSAGVLQSHIADTGIQLPMEMESLYLILLELHEIGLLFLVNDCKRTGNLQVVLNTATLTSKVHESLFSKDAMVALAEKCTSVGSPTSLNIGVIPQDVLRSVLPEYITNECLIHLQYCQKICYKNIGVFLDTQSTDQSFLFFPALCSADKSDNSPIMPSDLYFSIGWLAQCTDPYDYFPPRFLHVLLLRLVFSFTLAAPTASEFQDTSTERRCAMWKTGIHWLMREGVECQVELVNDSKEVVVTTKSEKENTENCVTVFQRIVSCVIAANVEFCHSVKPQFFLFDTPDQASNQDHLFAMSEVEEALTSSEGIKVVVSVNGKGQLKREKFMHLRRLTHWYSVFPIDYNTVLDLLSRIVRDLYELGRHLGIPQGLLDEIEADFPADTRRRRRELVRVWPTSPDPPCWWHLVQALNSIDERVLAEKVKEENRASMELQEKLLSPQFHGIKPDVEFLESFAGVVGTKWPALAASLSLSEEEIEEVRREEQDCALRMLEKWVSREDATYEQLSEALETISLLHC